MAELDACAIELEKLLEYSAQQVGVVVSIYLF